MSVPLEQIRLRIAAGMPPGDLDDLPAGARAYLEVAEACGAPSLGALDAACAAADDHRRAERAVEVAAAQGRAVVTGLTLAPLVLVPFLSSLFDLDLLAYHRTPLGMATGALAVLLLAAGAAGAHLAVRRVGRPPRTPAPAARRMTVLAVAGLVALGLHPVAGAVAAVVGWRRARASTPATDPRVADAAELAAVAVAGGASPAAALRTTAEVRADLAGPLRAAAFDLERGSATPAGPLAPRSGRGSHTLRPTDLPGWSRLTDVLTTADAVGAPVGPTLRRFAADVRADELARVLAAAERLPVQLTFPTALASLPGVLLLVGAPIVHGALAVAP